jgi:hypothetical protein
LTIVLMFRSACARKLLNYGAAHSGDGAQHLGQHVADLVEQLSQTRRTSRAFPICGPGYPAQWGVRRSLR